VIRSIPFALALALASAGADAAERHHVSRGEAPLKIVVETIEHSKQRYPTVGDWQLRPDGLHIYVSKMSDSDTSFWSACTRLSRLTSHSIPASHPRQ
jgi:hypothetical protein